MHDRQIADISYSTRGKLSHSKFLGLPLEIRLMIYKALIGERLVHLRLGMSDAEPKSWRHVICHGDGAKMATVPITQSDIAMDPESAMKRDRAIDDWEPAHHSCKWRTYYESDTEKDHIRRQHFKMHLSILRCCKQTFTEANPILWSTNTFSIHDHHTLQHFMSERNATQKGYIKKLRLRFDLKKRLLHYRRRILTPELMKSFPGLETLYLILEDELDPRLALTMSMTGRSLVDFGGDRIDPGLETLSLLPLKRVFVEVYTPDNNPSDERWRRDYAEMVQRHLQSPRT